MSEKTGSGLTRGRRVRGGREEQREEEEEETEERERYGSQMLQMNVGISTKQPIG